uniref:Xylulose kinase-1 n=1 Tax=Tanacetum cinerariifolium TaxID=118510 RepID=A0A6L2J479_TANCI|nr:hypothetical protein [Tanacetum cinerariifolium]
MVAYLTKSDASEGFNQVIDFLNGSYIKYALTVNPNIYVSCIKHFWNTVAIKQDTNVTRLQSLVDKKKVVVIEAVIREVLRFDDAGGVDCLSNEEIFAELARMGYEKPSTKLTFYKAFFLSQWKFLIHTILHSMSAKRTSWNEFSSAMASAVICLSTGRKFNFSKYIFDSLDKCLRKEELKKSMLKIILLLKKMILLLKEMMLINHLYHLLLHLLYHHNNLKIFHQHPRRVEHLEYDKVAQALEITKLKSRVKKLEKEKKGRIIDDLDKDDVVTLMDDKEEDKKEEEAKVVEADQVQGRQVEIYKIDVDHASKVLSMQEDEPAEVVAAASTRRRKGVIIRDPEEESTTIIPADTKSKDKGKGIMVEEPKPIKKKQKQKAKEDPAVQRYQVMKKRPQTEAQARKNMIMYLKNVAGFILDYFKGMSYDDIPHKAAKRRKLNEEVEDLKRHLEIMPDEDDDVYTEATPLARKVPVMDYEIIHLNNKPYYKIIRADGTHQLFVSFLTLLKNFNREDLESLWSLVKERLKSGRTKGLYMVKQRTMIPTLKVYTRSNVECSETLSGGRKSNVLGAVMVHKTTESRRPARMMVEYILHQELSDAKQKLMLLDSATD